jgi:hypothetical protein
MQITCPGDPETSNTQQRNALPLSLSVFSGLGGFRACYRMMHFCDDCS